MQSSPANRTRVLLNLHLAIQQLESAGIYTIHSFCNRVLGQAAFEAGIPLEPELVKSVDKLAIDCAGDVFNETYHDMSEAETDFYWKVCKLSYTGLCELAKVITSAPNITLLPTAETALPDFLAQRQRFISEFGSDWHELLGTELEFLKSPKGGKCFQKGTLPSKVKECLAALNSEIMKSDSTIPRVSSDTLPVLKILEQGFLANKVSPGAHFSSPIVDAFQPLHEHLCQEIGRTRSQLAQHIQKLVQQRMAQAGEQSYNDVLHILGEQVAQRDSLREVLRSTYKAALIDEFQDTDSSQWDIFSQILDPKMAHIYLIGDPKQAIYGFRGANIHVYHAAAETAAEAQFTLDKNWRSDQDYVNAMNCLFSRNPEQPSIFQSPSIAYIKVQAAKTNPRIQFAGRSPRWTAPLQLRWLQRAEDADDPIKTDQATDTLAETTAQDIVSLLEQCPTIEDKETLRPGHIAVLVRDKFQGKKVRDALARRGVPASFAKGSNLFDSGSQTHMRHWLRFVQNPRDQWSAKTAASTPLFGWTIEDFEGLAREERGLVQRWERLLEQAHGWNKQLVKHGVAAAFYATLDDQPVISRLLSQDNGERQAANVLHLLEFMHTKEQEQQLSPMQLLEWLTYEKERQTIDADTSEMRLETDAETVTITTIHSSKGLEYPVVFLPYLWDKAYGKPRKTSGGPYPIYADPDDPTQRILQLQPYGSEVTRATEIIALEDLQESMRLLYVAFTRAELRCVVYGGEIQNFEYSALAHLLFPDPSVYEDREISALSDAAEALFAQAPELHFSVIEATESTEKWNPLSSAQESPLVQAFSRSKFQYLPRPDSFSRVAKTITLSSDRSTTEAPTSGMPQPSNAEETATEDHTHLDFEDGDAEASETHGPERVGIRDFPSGSEPGKCLHDIFELLDFSTVNAQQELFTKAQPTLVQYGLLDKVDPSKFVEDLKVICNHKLGGFVGPYALSDIPSGQWIPELRFNLQFRNNQMVNQLVNESMQLWAEQCPRKSSYLRSMNPIRFESTQLTGAIDLIFKLNGKWYIADYKSNRCREDSAAPAVAEHFAEEPLLEEILSHHYPLQYVLYSLALHQYLKLRLGARYNYTEHFGGVCYLFLRGMTFSSETASAEPEHSIGVFHDRLPDPALKLLEQCCHHHTGEE